MLSCVLYLRVWKFLVAANLRKKKLNRWLAAAFGFECPRFGVLCLLIRVQIGVVILDQLALHLPGQLPRAHSVDPSLVLGADLFSSCVLESLLSP